MSFAPCAICRQRRAEVGVACAICVAPLGQSHPGSPDRIAAVADRPAGALIDRWGRPHLLDPAAEIGRMVPGRGVTIADLSVSRRHAALAAQPDDDAWVLRDHGSANGTMINGERIEGAGVLRHGDRVSIGQVELCFVVGVPALIGASELLFLDTVPPTTQASQAVADDAEVTQVGVREMSVRLLEPTGGGAGVVEIEGRSVPLSLIQFEVLRVLVERMRDDHAAAPVVRGFIRSTELVSHLSWDTSSPGEDHLKQVVRRLRRTLAAAGVADPIESRHRFGYRLAARLRTPAVPDDDPGPL